jgi:membrane protein DedA with SNARE-associated domain
VASGNPASIATTVTTAPSGETTDSYEAHRGLLLGLAAARVVLGLVAIPLAPFLYRDHIALLVLLRPTKEVLLLAGYVLRQGDADLLPIVLAALPLLLGGVWVFFGLGRAYADCIDDDSRTGLARRLLPPDKIRTLTKAVCAKGVALVFLGRLAAFPSTLVGAAAGGAEVPTRKFLLADTAGAVLSLAVLLGLGYALEETYDKAGPWLTAGGVAVLVVAVVLLGRSLKKAGRTP